MLSWQFCNFSCEIINTLNFRGKIKDLFVTHDINSFIRSPIYESLHVCILIFGLYSVINKELISDRNVFETLSVLQRQPPSQFIL